MITYSWKIEQLEAYPQAESQNNVVFCVHWRLYAQQDQYTDASYGTVNVVYAANTSYTPYESLTEQQVINWVETTLGVDQVQKYKTQLSRNIANQMNPPVVIPPLPWVA